MKTLFSLGLLLTCCLSLAAIARGEPLVKLNARQTGGYIAVSTAGRGNTEIVPLADRFQLASVPETGFRASVNVRVSVLRVVSMWNWFRKPVTVCVYLSQFKPDVSVPHCPKEREAKPLRSLRNVHRQNTLIEGIGLGGPDGKTPFRMAWHVANRWFKSSGIHYRVPFGHWLYVFPADMRHLLSTPGMNHLEVTVASSRKQEFFASSPLTLAAERVVFPEDTLPDSAGVDVSPVRASPWDRLLRIPRNSPSDSGADDTRQEVSLSLSEKDPNHADAKSDKSGSIQRRTLRRGSPVIGETCSICFETLEEGSDVALCQCDQVHPYCYGCLADWRETSRFGSFQCPTCKRKLQQMPGSS